MSSVLFKQQEFSEVDLIALKDRMLEKGWLAKDIFDETLRQVESFKPFEESMGDVVVSLDGYFFLFDFANVYDVVVVRDEKTTNWSWALKDQFHDQLLLKTPFHLLNALTFTDQLLDFLIEILQQEVRIPF